VGGPRLGPWIQALRRDILQWVRGISFRRSCSAHSVCGSSPVSLQRAVSRARRSTRSKKGRPAKVEHRSPGAGAEPPRAGQPVVQAESGARRVARRPPLGRARFQRARAAVRRDRVAPVRTTQAAPTATRPPRVRPCWREEPGELPAKRAPTTASEAAEGRLALPAKMGSSSRIRAAGWMATVTTLASRATGIRSAKRHLPPQSRCLHLRPQAPARRAVPPAVLVPGRPSLRFHDFEAHLSETVSGDRRSVRTQNA